MRAKSLFKMALFGAVGISLVSVVSAEPPKMKMTTEIPVGIAIPDRLDTTLGILNFFDGVPDNKTAQKVYDNLDHQHAVQAYLSRHGAVLPPSKLT